MRYGTGRDYFSYLQIYNNIIPKGENPFPTEPLSFLLFKTLDALGFGYQGLLFLGSFTFIFVTYYCIIRLVPERYRFTGLLVLICLPSTIYGSLSLIRQYYAVPLIVVSVYEYQRVNRLRSLVYILTASLFHNSALIFIPIYLAKFRIQTTLLVSIGLFLCVLFFSPGFIEASLSGIRTFVNVPIADKYLQVERNLSILRLAYFGLVTAQFIFLIQLRKAETDKSYAIFHDLVLGGLFLQLAIFLGLPILSRLLPYFLIFYPVAVWRAIVLKLVNPRQIYLFFGFIFLCLEVQNHFEPAEFSKYSTGMSNVLFIDSSQRSEDILRHRSEENILYNKVMDGLK
jgi:hypothetical protein